MSPMRAPMSSSCTNCSLVSRSLTRSTPTYRPSPRMSPIIWCFSLSSCVDSRRYLPVSAELATRSSDSMTSMFLSAAAAATGCPENVRVWFRCRFGCSGRLRTRRRSLPWRWPLRSAGSCSRCPLRRSLCPASLPNAPRQTSFRSCRIR